MTVACNEIMTLFLKKRNHLKVLGFFYLYKRLTAIWYEIVVYAHCGVEGRLTSSFSGLLYLKGFFIRY
jgi:hypothetical protein